MVAALQPLQSLGTQQQAVHFHSRERRRSLAGIPELFRTHRFAGTTSMAVASIASSTIFPDAVNIGDVTFKTVIEIANNADARSGLIFEFSDAAGGIALFLTDTTLVARAGSVSAAEIATAAFDNSVQWPATLQLELVVAVRPGLGLLGIFTNGALAIRDQSSGGDLGSVGWVSGAEGSFAAAADTAVPADVSVDTAPANFSVIKPLSIFVGQSPRQLLTPLP